MDLRATLDELARKAEPGVAPCLRCTAICRLFLAELAMPGPSWAEIIASDEEIQVEVDALLAARPELAARYDARGMPIRRPEARPDPAGANCDAPAPTTTTISLTMEPSKCH